MAARRNRETGTALCGRDRRVGIRRLSEERRALRGDKGKAAVSDPGYGGVGGGGGGREATSTRNCQGNGCCAIGVVGAGARHQGHTNVYEPRADSSSPPSLGCVCVFFLMRLYAGHATGNGVIINIIRYYYTFSFRTIADVSVTAVVTAVSTNRCSSIVPPLCVQDDDFTIIYSRNLLY